MADDLLVTQSLAMEGEYEQLLCGRELPFNDRNLWHLMRLGLLDQGSFHRPMDTSSHSMRYSVVMTGCLWTMVDSYHAPVLVL